MRKHKSIVYLAGFLFTGATALTSYVNSSFLEKYLNEKYVGLIYIVASMITIWGMLKLPKILSRVGNRSMALSFATLNFLALLGMAFIDNIYSVLFSFAVFFISLNFLIASFDIFVEDMGKHASVGKLRGFFLMFVNLAWVVAQFISSFLIDSSSFRGVYVVSASFMFLASIIFIFFMGDFKDPKYTKVPVLETFKVFIKNKDLSKIYLINLILKLFFAWMVIYTPIYLHEFLGFSWGEMGVIFTIMLVPFVLVDYPLGKLSDKMGEKKILIIGFIITAVFTLIIPFITESAVWIWAIILFGTRVGAATIEVMSEEYFFKAVKEKNADEISFFRNTFPMAYIIAPAIATPLLLILPSFKYLFLVVVAFLIFGFFITLRLRDIK